MAIQFTCPQCSSQTNVDDRFAGQTGPCRTCGALVTIPGEPTHPFATPPARRTSSSPALWIALGCGGFAALLVVPILIALLLPAVQAAREAARRSQCNNNLKQIGIALMNYADVHGTFPPAYIADVNGRPMHSWRVLVLPFMEQKALYDQYDFKEPWDGPNNSRLAALIPPPYRCPTDSSAAGDVTTSYAVITGPGAIFDGETATGIADISDGTSNTLLVVETTGAGIHWMAPRDLDVSQMTMRVNGSPAEISSQHPGGAQVIFADGRTSFLQQTIDPQTLRALTTKAGGEAVGGKF